MVERRFAPPRRRGRLDRVSRMERARTRRIRRRVWPWVKWAAVAAGAWIFSRRLTEAAAGGLSGFDAAVIFLTLVVLWAILEGLGTELFEAARERARLTTRRRVTARRSGRGA